ncbi:MAG: gliding motility-associated peptidyl-prolyl isomerase GldI [Flavobacterium sp. BFFFF1]|uniref:gliding motility-associated peptidyl-prolyl isomerase GldI n=1 Tax=unclassified Flavobacterium TaxID=196869 RepID=UPI000BD69287|nr:MULTISPECIES: gliding motility-associated peptidyl-prolyl isomerase GldI [unclassified Flavobacterium]OYU80130.1 MAG: gliding motility-associated peptidyl-prolyl isomerase GldI [Flavobacterium sp. BFFFF1]
MKKIHMMALTLGILFTACSQQQARKPISNSSGTFMKESVERNKKLVAGEEAQIDSIIKSNPGTKYIASKKGYWYYYIAQNTKDTIHPKKGDIAYFDYELKSLDGNVIYSEVELRPQVYHVDKQNIMMGLRDAIKLMKKNETVTFLFPSHMAYGYHGDNKSIGPKTSLICTVTLNDIKPDTEAKASPTAKTNKPLLTPDIPVKQE